MDINTPASLVTPLRVHRVALASMVSATDDAPDRLLPVLAIWVDTAPLDAAGVGLPEPEAQRLPVLTVLHAHHEGDRAATIALVVAPLGSEPATFAGSGAGAGWLLRLPATHLGLVTALAQTELAVRMVLVSGPVPTDPEAAPIEFDQARAVIWPDESVVAGALRDHLPDEWVPALAPVPRLLDVGEAVEQTAPMHLIRDQLWAAVAGLAQGHSHALGRTVSLAAWADSDEASSGNRTHRSEMVEVAQRLLTHSAADIWASHDPHHFPATMTALVDDITERVPDLAWSAIARGLEFDELCELLDFQPALLAVCVAAAASAQGSVEHEVFPEPASASHLLATWVDENTRPEYDGHTDVQPWWASRATQYLLLHHDNGVLVDLLTLPGEDHDVSVLGWRWLHVLVEALAASEMTSAEFSAALPHLDILVPGLFEIEDLCTRLMDAHAFLPRDEKCPACTVLEVVLPYFPDTDTLISSAVGALPVLADLQAELDHQDVGSEEWRIQRSQYLSHWLHRTAVLPLTGSHRP